MEVSFTGNFNDDVLFQVMLHADLNTIENIYMTHKNNYNYFWKKKFEKDELPIIKPQTSFNQWENEYIKIMIAKMKSDQLLQILQHNKILINYTSEDFNFNHILPKCLLSKIYNQFQSFGILYNSGYKIYSIDLFKIIKYDIDDYDLYELLIYIYYHYPNMGYIVKKND